MQALCATIMGPVNIISEGYIFRCLFPIKIQGDIIKAALCGDLGKQTASMIRQGDNVVITDGKFVTEKTHGKVFVINGWHMDREDHVGRKLDLWG